MNDIVRTLATPVSPLMVQFVTNNHAPAAAPSGALEVVQTNPWKNLDGTTNTAAVAWTGLSLASAFAAAYHGAKRNRGSVGWGLLWGLAGGIAPVIVPAIAIAQGYAKPEK